MERILNPAYVLIHAHLLSAEVLHADETRWMLRQKGGSKPSLRGLVGTERDRALQARKEARKKESEPLMHALKAWALEQFALPGSLLYKAISYMLGIWPGLMRFVDDPRVPIDNNLVERDLRGMVVGKKNH